MLADELCRRIEGANYFQWLLTKFSTPEEIFGAVSLKGLEEDDYRRVTRRSRRVFERLFYGRDQ